MTPEENPQHRWWLLQVSQLAQLRKIGVRSASINNGDIHQVDFYPAGEPSPPDASPVVPKPEPFVSESGAGVCACLHDMLEHSNEGLCLQGCSMDTCVKGLIRK